MEGTEVEAVAAQVVLRAACTWRRGAVEQLVALLSGVLVVHGQVAAAQQAGVDVEQVVRLCIGDVDDVSKKLVEDTLKAVQLGLSEVRPFNRLGNVGAVINEFAQSQGYKVVRDIGGHGVGLEFHEDPFVSYVTRRDTGMLLVPGMVFTIEPMINLGTDEIFIDSDNDWTVYTEDGAPSAQWEVTVAVTEDGYEILAY